MSKEKITAHDEYWNEIHGKWVPVPRHWVGLYTWEVSHKVRRSEEVRNG